MRKGFLARQRAAELQADKYDVGDEIRAARGVSLQIFDLRRRRSAADQRVAEARQQLRRVDITALEAELAAALAEQEAIAEKIAALTKPASEDEAA